MADTPPHTFKNLTGKNILLRTNSGVEIIQASPTVAKVVYPLSTSTTKHGNIIIEEKESFGTVINLPDPEPHVFFIVDPFVLAVLKIQGISRPDVIAPIFDKFTFAESDAKTLSVKSFVKIT